MPESLFGRMVRVRRAKLRLPRAKLGALVGRSLAAVRSWEKGRSRPTNSSVLAALSAVLGVEEKRLFGKAGRDVPEVEASPTVEQALATLAPEAHLDEAASGPLGVGPENSAAPADPEGPARDPATPGHEPPPLGPPFETAPVMIDEPRRGTASSPNGYQEPSYAATSPGYYITTVLPPAYEPSYMEDESQRQLYRVRNLATIAFMLVLGIALIWAFSEGWSAFNTWWDDFLGSLRL